MKANYISQSAGTYLFETTTAFAATMAATQGTKGLPPALQYRPSWQDLLTAGWTRIVLASRGWSISSADPDFPTQKTVVEPDMWQENNVAGTGGIDDSGSSWDTGFTPYLVNFTGYYLPLAQGTLYEIFAGPFGKAKTGAFRNDIY